MFKMTIGPSTHRAEIQIGHLQERQRQGIRRAFYYLGKDLTRYTKKLILDKNKTGKIYKIRRLGRLVRHQSSAPGEPPANLTGKLRKSIDFDVIGYERMEFGSREIFTNRKNTPLGAGYGKYLEEGKGKRKRPFLIRAIKENEDTARDHFEREISKALKK